ncbi:hypothetical protein DRF75_01945 [Ehrlichia minasensis]|uniref:Transmembrane protein n=1 Tax=Ehrlichia minasensis TaxID=1242993 RepID=A0A4Q6I4R0_9RICK|nr:hypothetical protein [Ehrlichia minasensis]RZB12851.1 hypothetical protein DRF75_01945 [Ehrlichia minasensis]CEI85166.1 Uncharacterized protein ehr_00552 [Ehrlichia minasensis]
MLGDNGEKAKKASGLSKEQRKAQLEFSLYKLNSQDLARKKIVMAVCVLYALVFASGAILQSGVMGLSKDKTLFLGCLAEFVALLLCISFLVTGLYNVLYIEKERARLQAQLKKCEEKEDEIVSFSDDVAGFCETHANKFDLTGGFLTTIMQAIAVFSLMVPSIFNVSNIPVNTAFNLQGIVDTVGNIFFLIAASMFLLSYIIRCKNSKDRDGKSSGSPAQSFIFGSIFFGTFLILAGKVLLSFECRSGAMYTGNLGPFGMDSLPLGFITRAIGMAIFCIGYALMLYYSVKANEELEKKVQGNDLQQVSTGMQEIYFVESMHKDTDPILHGS